MRNFTVISFYTQDFACFATDLIADCERFDYSYDIRKVSDSETLVDVWDRKVEFIGESIERYGSVIWLDVECRIVAPIPEDWTAPLTSTFPMGNSDPVSTGVLWLNQEHAPLVKVWSRHARKYPDLPDDFVLEFLLREYDIQFTYIETEFFNREMSAQIVRGQWECENLIVQHPTTNRWPDPTRYHLAFNGEHLLDEPDPDMRIARKRKVLFWRNFGGDFDEVEQIMSSGEDREYELSGWVFHPASHHYAPVQYWTLFPEIYGVKPITRERFLERNMKGFEENNFRKKMLRRMRLAPEERFIYPRKRLGILKALGLSK